MSEFDDNPFADPFKEPSIQQATQPAYNEGLSDYDPFGTGPPTNAASRPVPNDHALITPTNVPSNAVPYESSNQQQQISTAEFQRRQEELDRKAEELARKEEELRRTAAGAPRPNNWPPLPSFCPIGPCFYQDINVEIPNEFQRIVRYVYYLWLLHILVLLTNTLGALALLFSLGEISTFGMALFYTVIFTPLSYLCWFRPLYKAFKNDSSFNFMVFFFIFFFQMLVSVSSAIGYPSFGACGWVGVSRAFKSNAYGTGVFLVLVAIISTVVAIAMAVLILWVHKIYRSTGASFSKAKQEFATGVMTNEHVRGMATDAASAAVRNQLNNPNANSGSRF